MTEPSPGRLIGLTGGIACGKSTVAEIFSTLGVPVVDTDVISRTVVAPPSPCLDQLVEAFGHGILQPDGSLDRPALRQRIFHDKRAKQRVEAILHPAIRELAHAQAVQAAQHHPLVLIVIPLLAEPGVAAHYHWLEAILGVRCSPAQQRARLMNRPGIDPDLAERMLAAQVTDAEREPIVTHWIDNDGDRDALRPQVVQLHQRLLADS
ncbi:dephospho-CoA kinase [Halothiobacillus sp. DCM-1]|uniref:dephospho-CoA kinase n=1 Tax=Halothiobacillus sp. DCM-1 TaxID=3112558 RepID=UPI0032470CD2